MWQFKEHWIGWSIATFTVVGAVLVEITFGNFLYDDTSSELTPVARILLVSGSTGILAVFILSALHRFLSARVTRDEAGNPLVRSRIYGIVSLVRGLLIAVVGIIILLAALSEAGIDIGPMLAGAGVLGIMLGLGAQTLLRDILAGVFFIAEDSFRIGEYSASESMSRSARCEARSSAYRYAR